MSPAARDRAITQLQDHYAQSHLEVEELERRLDIAERAKSDDELAALFRDLPALETAALVPTEPSGPLTTGGHGALTSTISATLGATTRRGRWRMPRHVRLRAVLGSVEVDLSDAELAHDETLVEVSAFLGSVVIMVPEGLAVECEGSAVLGSFDHLAQSAASTRDRRRVRIVGTARLGSVDIIVKRKGGVLEDIKSTVRGLLGG